MKQSFMNTPFEDYTTMPSKYKAKNMKLELKADA
jgi:hypothetical protein